MEKKDLLIILVILSIGLPIVSLLWVILGQLLIEEWIWLLIIGGIVYFSIVLIIFTILFINYLDYKSKMENIDFQKQISARDHQNMKEAQANYEKRHQEERSFAEFVKIAELCKEKNIKTTNTLNYDGKVTQTVKEEKEFIDTTKVKELTERMVEIKN